MEKLNTTVGEFETATVGDHQIAVAGAHGIAIAGDYGFAKAGGGGTATSGYNGTAETGDAGTAWSGDYGVSIGGLSARVASGLCGTLKLKHRLEDDSIITVIGYVGSPGINHNTLYRLNSNGRFV